MSFTLEKIFPENNYGLKYGLEVLIHTVCNVLPAMLHFQLFDLLHLTP